ncbi:sensor histidine kinase [Sediminibacterium soli]|uniref:sensor histidine kinase n=1 Tax=Sediminibacterium soli TaxID=2698829 RepID=UPI0013798820|nr:ATP-binding protein [Sediminibacterium soli]NCI45343.1 two-component sensor histidine kinase [Sediminibacterium soli]
MSFFRKHRLAVATTVYWLLLLYMIAALLFWFLALENQNKNIATIRLNELQYKDDPAYFSRASEIEDIKKRKTAQYLGEGITFLAVIVVGAVFVFRATRRQFRLSQQQQNFLMAITHELKTPIAVTQLNLETLQKRKLDEEKQQKLISSTLQEANRLNMLCNNILLATQLDAGYVSNKQEINLTDLVEGCVDDFRMRFPQRVVEEAITQAIYLNGDTLLLQMLVNNLVENAIKYSPKDTPVRVCLGNEQGRIRLSVLDEGYGIPAEERKKVFEKFYRIGNENTRKTKGTGLGLYLCRKIAESHNGYISVTDHKPSGTNFAVLFRP